MFDIKALYEAQSVEEALELRRRYPEASVLAGGTDLLIKIREGKLTDAEQMCIRDRSRPAQAHLLHIHAGEGGKPRDGGAHHALDGGRRVPSVHRYRAAWSHPHLLR